mmetsp:Transcript_17913/g.52603  ORF Transcript_17913/g.52603 Transcript_17913/m.52603 type:complete len:202 (+) Transcript_17913:114-719(+)
MKHWYYTSVLIRKCATHLILRGSSLHRLEYWRVCRNMQDHATGFELRPVDPGHADPAASQSVDHRQFGYVSVHPAGILTRVDAAAGPAARSEEVGLVERVVRFDRGVDALREFPPLFVGNELRGRRQGLPPLLGKKAGPITWLASVDRHARSVVLASVVHIDHHAARRAPLAFCSPAVSWGDRTVHSGRHDYRLLTLKRRN